MYEKNIHQIKKIPSLQTDRQMSARNRQKFKSNNNFPRNTFLITNLLNINLQICNIHGQISVYKAYKGNIFFSTFF